MPDQESSMEAGAEPVVRFAGLEQRFFVDEPNMVMFEFTVHPNARIPAPHYHKDVDEVIYALEGVTTTMRGGQKHELRPGQTLFIPRGTVHAHENPSGEIARSLIVMRP